MATFPGIDYLNTLKFWDGKTAFDLEKPRRILQSLGNPQNKVPAVLVAGTNGKGSVSALIAAIFSSAGLYVGQAASPHLAEVNERCLLDGVPVSSSMLSDALLAVRRACHWLELTPSYFEAISAASFLIFNETERDWMVIEVGLGGRLDATNTIATPQASVITSIGFDHTHLLGDTLGAIASEKAGILRHDRPAFCGCLPEEAQQAIDKHAAELGAILFRYAREYHYDPLTQMLQIGSHQLHLDLDAVALPGAHQLRNASLAAAVTYGLGMPESAINAGLRAARWPGRLERFTLPHPERPAQQVSLLTDAAHNPDGVETLAEYLLAQPTQPHRWVVVISILETKDWRTMLGQFRTLADKLRERGVEEIRFLFTQSNHQGVVKPSILREHFGSGEIFADPFDALHTALCSADDTTQLLISGSIYLLGLLRQKLAAGTFCTIVKP